MTNHSLKQLLQSNHNPDEPLKVADKEFDETIVINYPISSARISFENCQFNFGLHFKGVEFGYIRFFDCKINLLLLFNNCTSQSKYDYSIELLNSYCQNFNIENKSYLNKGIYSENGEIESVIFHEVTIEEKSIIVQDTKISKLISLRNTKINSGGFLLEVLENTNAKVFIEKCDLSRLSLSSSFQETITIEDLKCRSAGLAGTFERTVSLESVDFEGNMVINNAIFKDGMEILIFSTRRTSHIKTMQLGGLSVFNTQFLKPFSIIGGKNRIKSLNFISLNEVIGNIDISSSEIHNCQLSGNSNANIFFSHCSFNELFFDHFVNNGLISLSQINLETRGKKLKIENSDLGKTKFLNFNLENFNYMNFVNSIILEVTVSDNFRISEGRVQGIINGEDKVDYNHKRDFYRQLKMALEKQGDRIKSLEYKSLEMKYYSLDVKGTSNLNDKIILWAGGTNDFGQNFLKPIRYLLLASCVGYGLITLSLEYPLDFSNDVISLNQAYNALIDHSSKYFELLNPVHNLKSVYMLDDKENHEGLFIAQFASFTYRIIVAFFSFQIISAFRKYVKN